MKVIFIKDVKGQGKKGEVKEVKDGYGMNYLIKNKYAVQATSSSLNKLNKDADKLLSRNKEDAEKTFAFYQSLQSKEEE